MPQNNRMQLTGSARRAGSRPPQLIRVLGGHESTDATLKSEGGLAWAYNCDAEVPHAAPWCPPPGPRWCFFPSD